MDVGPLGQFKQKITYENRLKFCGKYQIIGHRCGDSKKAMWKRVPKRPVTLRAQEVEPMITPKNSIHVVTSSNEKGWVSAKKKARRSAAKSLFISGVARGFELLVREEGEISNMRLIDKLLRVIKRTYVHGM